MRALVAAGAAVAAYAALVEPRRLVTVRRTIALPQWPRELDGFRVALLSDIHSGVPYTGPRALGRAVDRINEERPDVVLLGGDYVDSHPLWRANAEPAVVAGQLGRLEPPTYAVLGNHDWRQAGVQMWHALEREGIPVLENEAAEGPRGVYVAGLADLRNRRPDLQRTLAQVPAGASVILLSHDPDVFPLVPERVALTVSGHTHGGQVAIPLLRRLVIPSRYGERYARGHIVEAGRHLYVTSGFGTSGLPVRLFAPPEIVVLELASAATT